MTYEGWSEIMYAVQDSSTPYGYFYFLLIIMLGPIFALQLFLVVISNKYNAVKAAEAEAQSKEGKSRLAKENSSSSYNNRSMRRNRIAPEESDGDAAQSEHKTEDAGAASIKRGSLRDGGDPALKLDPSFRQQRRRTRLQRLQIFLQDVALSEGLANVMIGLICLNMLILAMDSHVNLCELDDPSLYAVFRTNSDIFFSRAEEKRTWGVNRSVLTYKAIIEGSNIIFACLFVVELLIKMLGLGPRLFLLDPSTRILNLLDVLIVALSVSEVPSTFQHTKCYLQAETCFQAEQCGAGTGFAIMRVFRLIRLGKLLRKVPEIYKQCLAIEKSVSAVGALMTLLVLFILIFVILGMNVFGGVMTQEFDPAELMRGSNVYIELPLDPYRTERPASMPGRRGVITDVDTVNHANNPWKVRVWKTRGLEHVLGLGLDRSVWASDGGAPVANASVITGIVPRLNYDDFFSALITTFQIVTTEGWNEDMYDAAGPGGSAAALFFYGVIIVGNWMLLNMFIAIIIQKFAEQRTKAVDQAYVEMKRHFVQRFSSMTEHELDDELQQIFKRTDADSSGVIDKNEMHALLERDIHVVLPEREFTRLFNKYDEDRSGQIEYNEFWHLIHDLLQQSMQEVDASSGHAEKAAPPDPTPTGTPRMAMTPRGTHLTHSATAIMTAIHLKHEAEQHQYFHRGESYDQHSVAPAVAKTWAARVRVACAKLTENKRFDRFILMCIFYSSITLALDAPLLPDRHSIRPFLVASDYLMNFVFICECLAKVVAQTLRVYLSSNWSRLDALIVTTAILDMTLNALLDGNVAALAPLKTLRILRALRPLRLIARAKGLRVLIAAMFSSVKPILATGVIAIAICALLGLVGMQLLLGKMGTCSDNKVQFMRDCWGVDGDGVLREWVRYPANFDYQFESIVTVFTIATQVSVDFKPLLLVGCMHARVPHLMHLCLCAG